MTKTSSTFAMTCMRAGFGAPARTPPRVTAGSDPAVTSGVGQRDRADHLHLVVQLDPELLAGAAARLDHQRDHVVGGRTTGVLDEVRVHRRDPRTPGDEPLQA